MCGNSITVRFRARLGTTGQRKNGSSILLSSGLVDSRGSRIIGDDGLQVGSLSSFLPAIAIGGRGSHAGHLFSFIEDGFCNVDAVHCVFFHGMGGVAGEWERAGASSLRGERGSRRARSKRGSKRRGCRKENDIEKRRRS